MARLMRDAMRRLLPLCLASLALFAACGRRSQPVVLAPVPRSGEVVAGSTVAIRTVDRIDPQAAPGRTFAGVLSRELQNTAGQTVLTPGAPVQLSVQTGPAGQELRWSGVMIYGSWHLVRNQTGLGVPLGTLVQATTDAGLALRVGPGGTPEVATQGQQVRVPGQTLLVFRLDQPLTIEQMPPINPRTLAQPVP